MFECPVEIFQSEYEFMPLLELYKNLNPSKIVEIGSLYGGTLWYWLKYLKSGGIATVIDLPVGRNDSRYDFQQECHKTLWYNWAKEFNNNLNVIEYSSTDVRTINQVYNINKSGEIDFLFIDGDHSYQGVKADFELYSPLVRPGGIVAFHDIAIPFDHPAYGGVETFWKELKESNNYLTMEYVETPKWWGIGILWMPD